MDVIRAADEAVSTADMARLQLGTRTRAAMRMAGARPTDGSYETFLASEIRRARASGELGPAPAADDLVVKAAEHRRKHGLGDSAAEIRDSLLAVSTPASAPAPPRTVPTSDEWLERAKVLASERSISLPDALRAVAQEVR